MFKAFTRYSFVFLGALLLIVLPPLCAAQGTSATVSGFVTDSFGAKVPSATVTFTNTATNVQQTVTTNGAGLYRVTGLLPGSYTSTVKMEGFKTAIQTGIELQVEEQATLNISLGLGSASETVTVEAGAMTLETQTPTVSQVIEGRQVEDTPLNGRNAMNLVALTPGVVPQGSTSGTASNNAQNGSFTNAFGFGNYQISGGLANQGGTYLDGAPLNITQANLIAFVPSQDSIQEFRVESSVVNPQYGKFSGGVISFATKAGTDDFHGTVYDYLRNTIFNANNFFLSGINQPRPKQIQNQFGATLGGPIRKEKVFFFASFETVRAALGVPNLGRVPTAAELAGDFTADPKIINPVPVLGPMVAPGVYAFASYKQASCNGVLNKICLPGAASLPGDAIADPTSNYLANVLHYFPLPNTTNAGPAYNYSQTGKAASNTNTYDLRFDWSAGTKQKFFAKYARLDRDQQGTQFIFNNPAGPNSGTAVGATTDQYIFADTIIPNSTSVVNLRASFLRYFSYILPANTNVNLSAFGPFWAGIANHVTIDSFPVLSLSNNIGQPYGTLDNFAQQPMNLYTFSGTYSKVLGRHSLSIGGEVRQGEEYFENLPAPDGLFVFAGTNTSCIPGTGASPVTYNDSTRIALNKYCGAVGGPPTNLVVPGTGATPVADFLVGQFTVAPLGIQTTTHPSATTRYGGVFASDVFQLSPRLTITAGVRYELPGGFIEKHDNNAVIVPALANPLTLVNSTAYASRSDLQSHLTLFSPRMGFAFQPYTGTTVRGGYSLAYLPQEVVYNVGPVGSSVETPTTFVPAGYQLSAPLGYLPGTATPNTTLLQPIGRGYANNPTYFYGQSISGRDPFYKFPYLQQWNANVQQVFIWDTTMQLAYLGARGEHLPIANTFDINQLPDTAAPAAANRPYPQYQNVNVNSALIGDTYYHSLQATLVKRFRSGGTILGNYSWSKLLGTADSLNPQVETHAGGVIQDYTNLRGERSYTSFDVPQRLVVSYILDLPVGKGKRFLSNADGTLNAVVSGWNASGINTFQSGFPLAITATNNIYNAVYGAGTIRPNRVPGCNPRNSIGYVAAALQQKPILNAACFTAPVQFGNEPRTDGSLRTQGVDDWDFSLGKTTPITESVNVVFRAEAFNVLNRVQFGDPGLGSATGTFGLLTTQANQPRSMQFSFRLNY